MLRVIASVHAWSFKGPAQARVKACIHTCWCYRWESLVPLFRRRQHQTAMHFARIHAWSRQSRVVTQIPRKTIVTQKRADFHACSGISKQVFQVVSFMLWAKITPHSRWCLKQMFSFTWLKIVPWWNPPAIFVSHTSTKLFSEATARLKLQRGSPCETIKPAIPYRLQRLRDSDHRCILRRFL